MPESNSHKRAKRRAAGNVSPNCFKNPTSGDADPGVPGGGELKYYATANATGEVDIDQLSELIEKAIGKKRG